MNRPRGLYVLNRGSADLIYGPEQRAAIVEQVEIIGDVFDRTTILQQSELLREATLIFSGWGAPVMDENFLALAPQLQAVFYGAGSIRGFVTEAFWQRGIIVSSAYAANSVAVAEYTLATILLSLKHFWQQSTAMRAAKARPVKTMPVPGAYRSTVGVVSLGMIGRRVCGLLRHHDVRVIAYDPFTTPAQAAELNVELCSLDDLFRRADVVTLHTPWLTETVGLITGSHFDSMKPGATFINSARGAIVRETEMLEALQRRSDLFAILDVTYPEPAKPDSPLYTLPNVILTPHIAGVMDNECRRMGQYMVEELRRYLAGQPLQWQITKEQAARLA